MDGYGLLDTNLATYSLNITPMGNIKNRCVNISQPPAGFFCNNSDNTFKNCPSNCYQCTSATTCEVCRHLTNPAIKLYVNSIGQVPVCATCTSPCVECTAADVCLSC